MAEDFELPKRSVNVEKLKAELLSAKLSEDRYQRENDAKFRAIAQRVGTYEEFRDIVKASHLRPVDPKEITNFSSVRQPWNISGGGKGGEEQACNDSLGATDDQLPENTQEFLRLWRLYGRERLGERYRLLLRLGGEGIARLFPVDVSSEVVGDIISALHHGTSSEDFAQVVPILRWLSACKRLSLTIRFLSRSEKNCLEEMFVRLEQLGLEVDFKTSFVQ